MEKYLELIPMLYQVTILTSFLFPWGIVLNMSTLD